MTLEPWEIYFGRTDLPTAVGITLATAFADVVSARCGHDSYEIPEIATAEDDGGVASFLKDELRLQAKGLAQALVSGGILSFARPVGGGKVLPIPAEHWEIDDPLPRFATSGYNYDEWANASAPLTHHILVSREHVDRYLTSFLSKDEFHGRIFEFLDAEHMARVRLDRLENIEKNEREGSEVAAALIPSTSQRRILRLEEVTARVSFRRSKLYDLISKGEFPKQVDLGGRVGWYEHEVEAWITSRPRA